MACMVSFVPFMSVIFFIFANLPNHAMLHCNTHLVEGMFTLSCVRTMQSVRGVQGICIRQRLLETHASPYDTSLEICYNQYDQKHHAKQGCSKLVSCVPASCCLESLGEGHVPRNVETANATHLHGEQAIIQTLDHLPGAHTAKEHASLLHHLNRGWQERIAC